MALSEIQMENKLNVFIGDYMEKFVKILKTGLFTCLWNVLPLIMIGSAIWLFVDVKYNNSYYAALLFVCAVFLLFGAFLLIFMIGWAQIDYDELSDKRNKEFGLKLDSYNDEEIIDDITNDNNNTGANILCLNHTEF